MKKIFSTLLIILIISSYFINKGFAEESNDLPYSLKTTFPLYKERVKNICDEYKTKKELIKIEDTYEEIDGSYSLDKIKDVYKSNMNDIYKCALVSIQKRSLLLIKNDLIKKNPVLLENIGEKIDSKIQKIDATSTSLKCNNYEEKSSIIKLNLLRQTTYETCKYITYLEYLRGINEKIVSILPEGKNNSSIGQLLVLKQEKDDQIIEEINHTYKVFPMAFHAMTEYENNISIHFLLELLKDDYTVFREKLHEVLNPINQVVYKISNAMRK